MIAAYVVGMSLEGYKGFDKLLDQMMRSVNGIATTHILCCTTNRWFLAPEIDGLIDLRIIAKKKG